MAEFSERQGAIGKWREFRSWSVFFLAVLAETNPPFKVTFAKSTALAPMSGCLARSFTATARESTATARKPTAKTRKSTATARKAAATARNLTAIARKATAIATGVKKFKRPFFSGF
jgi:hypothetical protein